jgi:hypothetical protein
VCSGTGDPLGCLQIRSVWYHGWYHEILRVVGSGETTLGWRSVDSPQPRVENQAVHHWVEIGRRNGRFDLIDRYLAPAPRAKGSSITLQGYELCVSPAKTAPQGPTCEEFPLARQRNGARSSRVDLLRAFGPQKPGRYWAEWTPILQIPNGMVGSIGILLRFSIPRGVA